MKKGEKTRFVDSGWRVTVPKEFREQLGWDTGTQLCVSTDGSHIVMRNVAPLRCPDLIRMGALGKIVIPPKVRQEVKLYRGQILSLHIEGEKVLASPHTMQVRCLCGSEYDVKDVLPNVHLCQRCRETLKKRGLQGGGSGGMKERAESKENRLYVSVLTGGWRFTVPAEIRKVHGWGEGLNLFASVSDDNSLLIGDVSPESGEGVGCYLGSGGKMVVPRELRQTLSWKKGQRLAISSANGITCVTPCCPQKACRSCGSVKGVTEVIPGLYLCSECFRTYLARLKA